jgi:hypothetical protein
MSPTPNVPTRAPQAVLKAETTGELKEKRSARKIIRRRIHLTGREKIKRKKRLMGEPGASATGVALLPDFWRGLPLAFATALSLEHG